MTTKADILVEVGGDVTPLARAMRRGGRELDTFTKKGVRTGRAMARVGAAIVSAAAIGSAASMGLARSATDAAVEIANLSRVAGASPVEFQKMAVAARTVGIEHDKLSDILKDVQDRVGDFIATGGGPMADFFENIAPLVGVTADEFARLSGPEALQLYVSSLEKVNLSQSEMTFYMETMASDATALVPLLRDNGRALREIGDEAARTGRILSNETVEGAGALKKVLDGLGDEIRSDVTTAVLGLQDEMIALSDFVRDFGVPALEGLIRFAAGVAEGFRDASDKVTQFKRDANTISEHYLGTPAFADPDRPADHDAVGAPEDYVGNVRRTGPANAEDIPGLTPAGREALGLPPLGAPPDAPEDGAPPLTLTVTPPGDDLPDPLRPPGRGGARADRGPTEDDLEALAESLASERELITLDYEERLAALDEFKSNEIGEKEKWNDLEARIEKDHADKLAQLEEQKRAAKMQAIAGAFGDLSSLMQSENKKLFAIGKAAALAEATISGYEAAVDAWSAGMKIGGPPVAAAFTAASLAKTGMLISSISSTGASGGGGGGAGAGGGGSVAAPAPEPAPALQQVNLSIGDADFVPHSAMMSLAEKLQELSRKGAIVTVN